MNGLEKAWLLLPKFSRCRFFSPFWSDFFLGTVLMHKIISGSCDQNSISVLRKEKWWKQAAFLLLLFVYFFFFSSTLKKKKKSTVVQLVYNIVLCYVQVYSKVPASYTYTYIHSLLDYFSIT